MPQNQSRRELLRSYVLSTLQKFPNKYVSQSAMCHDLIEKQIIPTIGKTPVHSLATDFIRLIRNSPVAATLSQVKAETQIIFEKLGHKYIYRLHNEKQIQGIINCLQCMSCQCICPSHPPVSGKKRGHSSADGETETDSVMSQTSQITSKVNSKPFSKPDNQKKRRKHVELPAPPNSVASVESERVPMEIDHQILPLLTDLSPVDAYAAGLSLTQNQRFILQICKWAKSQPENRLNLFLDGISKSLEIGKED